MEVSSAGRDPESLVVEVGDHHAFPLPYIEGAPPASPPREGRMGTEEADKGVSQENVPDIALSYSASQDLEVTVGDLLTITDTAASSQAPNTAGGQHAGLVRLVAQSATAGH